MPVYLDIHNIGDATVEDIARAHAADLDVQAEHGVEYMKYWLNERTRKVFCLCRAPDAEAAARVHREAHGMEAERVIEVEPDVLDGFLGGGSIDDGHVAMHPMISGERDPGVRVVMFTDIVGSTAFTQRHGDRAALDMLTVHDQIVRMALSIENGREVKHTGDGIMASFASVMGAVRCASRIQEELARYSATGKFPLRVRIGEAAGEPIERHNDIFGSTVQLAARLCAHAEPAQTLVSDSVATHCPSESVRLLGEVSLKGFDRPERVHVVEWSRAE